MICEIFLFGVLDEGSSETQTIIQAGYALGEREDRPMRCEMPAYDEEEWQERCHCEEP